MLMNNKFESETNSNPKSYRKSMLVIFLAPHALNMLCSFGQSVRSVESKCVVTLIPIAFQITRQDIKWCISIWNFTKSFYQYLYEKQNKNNIDHGDGNSGNDTVPFKVG